MTYETKKLHYHVIHVKLTSDSRCSRTLPMNVAVKSAHSDRDKNLRKDWFWSKMC